VFRRLLLTRLQLPGLHKEICREWNFSFHFIYFTFHRSSQVTITIRI
jgi:hypothetical protein